MIMCMDMTLKKVCSPSDLEVDAMTNAQIIANIAVSLYGEAAVADMIENGVDIPLHTMKGWESRGEYKVKKGEHGIETKLWKRKKNTEDDGKEFYLAKAFLFSKEQVEKIAK